LAYLILPSRMPSMLTYEKRAKRKQKVTKHCNLWVVQWIS
jgi:hypothetical protein